MHGLFDLMDLYEKAMNKVIKDIVARDEAQGRKPRLLSEITEEIRDLDLGHGWIARHFYEGSKRKMRFMPKSGE